MDKLIDKHKLLNESQYGFGTNKATSLALIDSVQEITNLIDQKHHTVGQFIELKKNLQHN